MSPTERVWWSWRRGGGTRGWLSPGLIPIQMSWLGFKEGFVWLGGVALRRTLALTHHPSIPPPCHGWKNATSAHSALRWKLPLKFKLNNVMQSSPRQRLPAITQTDEGCPAFLFFSTLTQRVWAELSLYDLRKCQDTLWSVNIMADSVWEMLASVFLFVLFPGKQVQMMEQICPCCLDIYELDTGLLLATQLRF